MMVTKMIDVHKTEVTLQELLSLIKDGAEVILTDEGTQLARILPIEQPTTKRVLDLHPGAIWTSDDFDDPLPDEFWLGEAQSEEIVENSK
jgi:antitoxin (DNA-binding transcriptional repressor) of toxin-antitoxin stability system